MDNVKNAQGSARCALKIRDSPRIWFQPFKTLAGHRIDDCAVAVLQVVRSQHLSISEAFHFTAGPLPAGSSMASFLRSKIFMRVACASQIRN